MESLTEAIVSELNPQSNDHNNQTETENYLADLVGEGKKYSTIEEAAKALAKKARHADEFIETLKVEKQQVLNELAETKGKVQTAQELLELMREREPAGNNISTDSLEETPRQSMTQEDVAKTIDGILQQREAQAKRKAAFESSFEKLTEAFGSAAAAKERVASFIAADPANKVIVDTVGISNPAKLIKMIKEDLGEPEEFSPARDTGSVTRFDKATSGLTWSKAKEIKKSTPALYNSVKFQKKLQEAIDKNPTFYSS